MRTLHGTSRYAGVAMAVGVVFDVQSGLSGLPERIIKEGLKAMRMRLPESEQPEVVVICDQLALGSAVRIPGVRTIGVVAQGDDQASMPVTVPCVTAVPDILRSIQDEEIIIVDGNEGIVILGPDVETVIRYQRAIEPEPAERVFLESTHLPARTQDGRVVTVTAVVSSVSAAERAIAEGADALVVRFARLLEDERRSSKAAFPDARVELLELLCAMSGGKPLTIALRNPDKRLKELVAKVSDFSHVNIIDPVRVPVTLDDDGVKSAVDSGRDVVCVTPDAVARVKTLIRTLPENGLNGGGGAGS